MDAEGGIRRPAFDHPKLAGALSKACGQEFKGGRLPFAEIEFIEEGKAIRVEAGGKDWRYDLNTCECMPIAKTGAAELSSAPALAEEQDEYAAPVEASGARSFAAEREGTIRPRRTGMPKIRHRSQKGSSRGGQPAEAEQGTRSPDGKWSAFVRGQNVFMRLLAEGVEFN